MACKILVSMGEGRESQGLLCLAKGECGTGLGILRSGSTKSPGVPQSPVTAAVQVAACVSPRPVPWLLGCGQSLLRIIRKQEAQLGLGILSLAKGHKGFAALIHRPDKASHFKKPSLLQMY